MKKKYLRPVPKTVDENDLTKASDAKNTRRGLSLKKIAIILAAFLVVSVAVVVPVCIVYVDIPVDPAFETFDQQTSYTVTVKWKRVAAATKYELEYRHADPVDASVASTRAETENNGFTIRRYAGPLFVRVRAYKGKRTGKYSDWIRLDIEPWTLAAPTVTINETTLQASWTPVNFRFFNDYSNVAPAYVYDIGWKLSDGDVKWNGIEYKTIPPRVDISLVFTSDDFEPYLEYYAGLETEWPGDITLYVKAAAKNRSTSVLDLQKDFVDPSPEMTALSEIYDARGEYGEADLIVTKDVFDIIPKEIFDALLKSKGWTKN